MRNIANALVLGLILAMAFGLLLVLIQRVRESDAQFQCQNNSRQLILGLHNYESAYGSVPKATMENAALPAEKRFSWLISTFPYLEAENVYRKLNLGKSWDAEENRFAALLNVKLFHCPSLIRQRLDSPFVPTHYIGITGIGSDAASLPQDDPSAGVFGYERTFRIATTPRGASNQLAIMETTQVTGAWTAGGRPTVRGLEDGTPLFGRGGQFGGTHARITQAAFLDGSVRRVRDTADPELIKALATIHGMRLSYELDADQ